MALKGSNEAQIYYGPFTARTNAIMHKIWGIILFLDDTRPFFGGLHPANRLSPQERYAVEFYRTSLLRDVSPPILNLKTSTEEIRPSTEIFDERYRNESVALSSKPPDCVPDYYAIMGVSPDASISLVKLAFAVLLKAWQNGEAADAIECYSCPSRGFKKDWLNSVLDAFAVLTDLSKRKAYEKLWKQAHLPPTKSIRHLFHRNRNPTWAQVVRCSEGTNVW